MKTSVIAMAAAGLAIVVVGGTWGWTQMQATTAPFASCTTGQVAGGAIGGPFELVNTAGATVTDADLITKPTLLYFGYTFCPDVCPLATARNVAEVEALADRGLDAQAVFVTVDPARDTPEAMAWFTDSFGDDLIGLTGSDAQIKAAATAYRVYYDAKVEDDPEYYLVDHSAFTYLVLPETGFIDFFRHEATVDDMVEPVACVIEAASN